MCKGVILKSVESSIDEKCEDTPRYEKFQELHSRISITVAVKLSSLEGSVEIIILDEWTLGKVLAIW